MSMDDDFSTDPFTGKHDRHLRETNDAALIAMRVVEQHARGLLGPAQVRLSHAIMMAILEDRKRNKEPQAPC